MEKQNQVQTDKDQKQKLNDPNAQTDNETDPTIESDEGEGEGESDSNQGKNGDRDHLVKRLKETANEAKGYRQKNSELKAELDRLKREQAEKNGDYKTLAETAEREKEEANGKVKKITKAFGSKLISTALATEALKMGCIDTESVTALVDVGGIGIDEDFEVDTDEVRQRLEDVRKRKPHLFNKKAPGVKDVKAGSGENAPTKTKSIDEMTTAELEEALAKMQ